MPKGETSPIIEITFTMPLTFTINYFSPLNQAKRDSKSAGLIPFLIKNYILYLSIWFLLCIISLEKKIKKKKEAMLHYDIFPKNKTVTMKL